MPKSYMGARVKYCNHDGTFVADIFEVAGACVVANIGFDIEDNLTRPARNVTHYVQDFPTAGYWRPHQGVLVVPAGQVLTAAEYAEKYLHEPVDLKRCQAARLGGSFMTLGPRQYHRCTNEPAFVATQKEPGEDGVHGQMSLCTTCLVQLEIKHGKDYVLLVGIP